MLRSYPRVIEEDGDAEVWTPLVLLCSEPSVQMNFGRSGWLAGPSPRPWMLPDITH